MNMVGGACLGLVGDETQGGSLLVLHGQRWHYGIAVEGHDMIRPACRTLHAHGDA